MVFPSSGTHWRPTVARFLWWKLGIQTSHVFQPCSERSNHPAFRSIPTDRGFCCATQAVGKPSALSVDPPTSGALLSVNSKSPVLRGRYQIWGPLSVGALCHPGTPWILGPITPFKTGFLGPPCTNYHTGLSFSAIPISEEPHLLVKTWSLYPTDSLEDSIPLLSEKKRKNKRKKHDWKILTKKRAVSEHERISFRSHQVLLR